LHSGKGWCGGERHISVDQWHPPSRSSPLNTTERFKTVPAYTSPDVICTTVHRVHRYATWHAIPISECHTRNQYATCAHMYAIPSKTVTSINHTLTASAPLHFFPLSLSMLRRHSLSADDTCFPPCLRDGCLPVPIQHCLIVIFTATVVHAPRAPKMSITRGGELELVGTHTEASASAYITLLCIYVFQTLT